MLHWCARVLILLLVFSASAFAQPQATPTSVFFFDQPAPDVATAQAYTYKLYADGSTTGQTLTGVVCAAGATSAVQVCRVPIPAFQPGQHSITLSATNAAGESPKSAAFTFTLVAVPGTPGNIRIGSGS